MRPYRFQAGAADEAAAAAEYYDRRRIGLGSEFLTDLEECLRIAREFPEAGRPYELSSRRLLFHRYPFALIYTVDRNGIEIVAIAHERQEPGYWRTRL